MPTRPAAEATALGDDALIDRVALAEAQQRILGRSATVRIGRYLILERIGKGGMGEVCSAYDPELDRKVAVKLLRSHLGPDPEARARLLREARALARLAHPNVVAVYDAGVIGRDVFIVMELVDGQTMSGWLRAAARDWREIRDLLVEAGRGLVAAHEAGIVHRDFKPSNVLVGRDPLGGNAIGRVRVLDFGLARTSAGEDTSAPTLGTDPATSEVEPVLTRTGIVMGTPAYMAPEQMLGSEVGPAADQFSFCVAMFEALYELRPFPDDVAGRLHAIKAEHVASAPASTRVPPWLYRAIVRGLRADPRDRFASMKELLAAMQLDRRKRRLGIAASVSAVVLAAIIAFASAWWLRPTPGPRELEVVERISAEAHEAAARAYFVYAPFDDPSLPSAYQKVLELEAQGEPSRELARARATELRNEFSATLVRLGDEYWDREGGVPFASDYYAQALAFDPDLAHARARTSLTPGEIATLADKAARGDWSTGERLAGESLAALAEADPEERRERVESLLEADPAPSASTSARLLALVERVEANETPIVAKSSESRPRAARAPERTEDEIVLVVADDEASDETPTPAKSDAPARDGRTSKQLVADARAAALRGRAETAEWLFRRALTHDSASADALAGLAEIEYDRGHYHAANRFARDAVGVAPRAAHLRILLGDTYFKTHEYRSAERHYEEARRLGHDQAEARLELLRKQMGG
jgi:tetratricopeptide (TPR) repeat protein